MVRLKATAGITATGACLIAWLVPERCWRLGSLVLDSAARRAVFSLISYADIFCADLFEAGGPMAHSKTMLICIWPVAAAPDAAAPAKWASQPRRRRALFRLRQRRRRQTIVEAKVPRRSRRHKFVTHTAKNGISFGGFTSRSS
jgi:hypothetical protein